MSQTLPPVEVNYENKNASSVPGEELVKYSSLRSLKLSGNNLQVFPPPLVPPKEGQSLVAGIFLGCNKITRLDPSISIFANLKVLYLSGNEV